MKKKAMMKKKIGIQTKTNDTITVQTKATITALNNFALRTTNGRVLAYFAKYGNFDRKLHAHNGDVFNVTITKVTK